MPRRTQAEIFIETLADMLNDDRTRRAAQLLRLNKAHVEKFRTWHPVGASTPPHAAYWPVHSARGAETLQGKSSHA